MSGIGASESLSLLIKPASYRCNLRCSYCFYRRVEEIYSGQRPFMDRAVAEAVIEKALSLGAKFNSFCWQGGEPTLLGLDFFKDVFSLQERHCKSFQIVENTLQTNGILLDEKWCRFLRQKNVLVGISLDGPAAMHNRYRRFPDGKGTFDRVMKSISLMKKNRVRFNILTLLTDANVKEPERLYAFLRKNNFNYLQFINCFEQGLDSDELTGFSVRGEDVGKFYCTLFDLWLNDGFPSVSIRFFEDVLIYYFDRVHVSCCWMEKCGSYVVVEHNGDVYPCDFFVYPTWKLGNVVTDDLRELLLGPLREKFSETKRLPQGCQRCEFVSFCQGDCPKFRKSHESSADNRSEYCIALKMLLEHMAPHMPFIHDKVMEIRSNPSQNGTEKIGRNDPCPCGSGIKYKRCCGGITKERRKD